MSATVADDAPNHARSSPLLCLSHRYALQDSGLASYTAHSCSSVSHGHVRSTSPRGSCGVTPVPHT